jgi:hypothetical protein
VADTKISALTAITDPAGTDELAINDGGVSKKITLSQINAFADPLRSVATSAMGAGFASDTYVTGSALIIPQARIQAGSLYRCKIVLTKTAASTATPTANIRYGTAGTTADTSRLAYTFVSAQTAAADTAEIEFQVTFRAVGSGTTGVLSGSIGLRHNLATTGFCTRASFVIHATSAGFDSTPTNSRIGVSMNGGASASWTVETVEAELINLT